MFSEQRLYKVIAHFLIWIQLLTPGLSLMPLVARAQEPTSVQDTVQGLNSLILEQGPGGNKPPDPVVLPTLGDGAGGTTRPEPAPRADLPTIEAGKTLGENGYFQVQTRHDTQAPTLSGLPDLSLPSEATADKKDTPKDKTADVDEGATALSSGATQMANFFSGEDRTEAAVNYARGLGEGLINQQINDWLNQYGNAKVSVGTQQKLSGDLLVPLYETDDRLIFTQVGTRTNEDRNTANLGVGYRQYLSDWMLGVNTFYDYDYTGKNKRIGVGTEAWADYLKLAANGYIRQTNWHQSGLDGMEDYDERPANGFDLRANAYLPAWPSLGGSLKYEQYFGSGVSMADSASPDDLKDNPVVVTAGLDYTPFPLITLSAKRSVGDSNETSVGFDLNYRFGTPWYEQISPDTVGLMRSLAGSKYDFVDRNYDIVMQYRKQDLLHIELPAGTTAQAAETVPVELTVSRAKYGLKGVEWTVDPQLTTRGGHYTILSPTQLAVTLPAYDFSRDQKGPQTYKISAVATDNNGNASNTAETIISVVPSENVVGTPVLSPDGQSLVANNSDFYTVSALVTDGKGVPLANQPLTFSLDGLMNSSGQAGTQMVTPDGGQSDSRQIKMTTQASGLAAVRVRSTVAGQGQITARMDNGNTSVSKIVFVGDKTTAAVRQVRLNDSVNYKTADPQNSFTYTGQVQDGNGNPLSDVQVTWSKDVQQGVTLSAATSTTGEDGNATVRLLGSTRAVSDITVSAGSGSQVTAVDADKKVSFIAGDVDPGKSTFAASPGDLTANGVATSALTLTLMDANANPVTGAAASLRVVVSGVDRTQVSAFSEGSPGVYRATLSGTRAGTATLTAMTGQKTASGQAPVVRLTADSNTAQIAQADLVIDPDGSPADGKTANRVTATVTDAYGNAVQGAGVTFSVTGGAAVTPASATSGADGVVTTAVTRAMAGSVDVGATVRGRQTTGKTHFVADVSTARVSAVTLSGGVTSKPANGTDGFAYTVKVVDAHDNAVPGVPVTAAKDHADGALSASNQGQTDANGEVTLTLSSTKAMADVKVSASVGTTSAVNADKAVSFVADSSTAAVTGLVVTTDGAVANGTATDAVTVTVKDVNSNPVSGAVVTLSADNGATMGPTVTTGADGSATATLTSKKAGVSSVTASLNQSRQSASATFVADVTTGTDGRATATLTSKTAGASKVTASLNGSSQSASASFVSDGTTAKVTGLVVTADGAVADGAATDAVKVTVQDVNSNPVAGAVVTLSADNATIIKTVTTGTDGSASATLTSLKAGASSVTASLGNSSQSASATFVADSTTATVTGLVVTTDNAVADGAATDAVTVTVKDANNNPVPNAAVTLSADNGATIAPTGTDGRATATLTSKTAGVSNVTASLNGSSQSASTAFVPDSTTATVTDLIVTTDGAVANGAATDAVTVTVKDVNSNPVPGAAVTLSADNGATIMTTVTTGADGSATATLTSKTAGASKVTASLNQSSQSASATFVPDSSTAAVTGLVVTTDGAVANGAATDAVTVTVQDVNSNPVAGAVVTLAADNGATIARTVTTGTDGSATATLTSLKAGVSSVTASLNGSSQSASASFVSDGSTATVTGLIVTTDGAVANGAATDAVKVTVKDVNSNPVAGAVVTLSADNGATIARTVTTGTDGSATATLTSKTAGVSSVTASLGGSSQSASATFVSDSTTAKVTDLIVTTDGAVADGAATDAVTVTVKDANNNPVPNAAVTLSADNGATIMTTVTTGTDGSATTTLTSKTAGMSSVRASLNGSSRSASANFVADSSTATVTGLTVTTDGAVADGTATDAVTVTVQDANSNPVTGAVVTLSADNGATIAPTVTTGTDGSATVTLTSLKAGVSGVTASLNKSSQSASATFVADVTTATVTGLIVTTDNAVANGAATDAVKMMVQDANSNPVAGALVTLSTDNGATIAPTVTTGTDGSASATLTSKTAGVSNVTVSLNGGSKSVNATFGADISTAHVGVVTLTDSTTTKIANSTDNFTYTAQVIDANGNLIKQPGVKVSWTQDKLDAVVLSSAESEVDGNGEATVQLTSTLALAADVVVSAQYGATPVVAADKRATFTYGEPASVTIKTTDGATTAVVGTQPSLAIEIVDAYGHKLPSQTVSLAVSGDKGGRPSVYPTSVSSDAQGVVSAKPQIADNTAEGVTVTGTVAANKATGTVVIRFMPDVVSTNTSTISAAPASIVADTLSTSTITYVPKDRYGNVINDIQTSSITSEVVGMSSTDINLSDWKSGNGQYTATLRAGSVTGSLKIIPVINGQDGVSRSGDDILALTAGQLDISKSSITAVPTAIIADGKSTTSLRFVPKDVFGNVISTLDVSSISQVITGTATDSKVGGWRYNANSQWYTATLTAGVMVGSANIMPTVAGNNAASVGVSNTLLLQYSSSVKDIQSSSTGTAVADGVTTNTVTVTVYGDNQQVKASQPVTITPPNTELLINGNSGTYSGTTNSAGQLTVTMSSTLSGENEFTIESDQYNQTGATSFEIYVSPTLSSLNFDKTDLYNNGTDVMKVTFAPRDAKNRPIAGIPVSVTSTDTGATLSQADYQTQVTSTSSPSTYFISVKMSNYTLWQPEEKEYQLIPTSGVRLATLTVQPKLCGRKTGSSNFICTPTPANDGSYHYSGLGFVVNVKERNAIWNNEMTLTSSDVDGQIMIKDTKSAKTQNCSAPVSQSASWMNDFGSKVDGVDYTMSMDFSTKSSNDTYDLGLKAPGAGGGIGLCDMVGGPAIESTLSGAGSVIFIAATKVPVSSNRFSVPLTGSRIDAGLVGKPMTVYIYSD